METEIDPNHQPDIQLPKSKNQMVWDIGTAYDLFISLNVLHAPEKFGLRASWAAGVRSRLPAVERKFLEEIYTFFWAPIPWIYSLPKPKDSVTAIWSIRQIPVEERLAILSLDHEVPPRLREVFLEVKERRRWTDADVEVLRTEYHNKGHQAKLKEIQARLNWWTRPEEFGECFLSAVQSYYQSFFEEEEKRIAPMLQHHLKKAQELALQLPLEDLLADLSQGLHFSTNFYEKEIILGPSYWSTPLVFFAELNPQKTLLLFGARPAEDSVVPGEQVPEGLLRPLKALSDPTRLRILHYLAKEPQTPAQLARKLRLRAPTVTHHLNDLRLAGLVQISLEFEGDTKKYAPRVEAISTTFNLLVQFIESGKGL